MAAQLLPAGPSLRRVVRSAFSLAAGRVALTLLRFGVLVMVVRRAGFETFGAYALLLSLVVVAEWIADFGQTDVAVRDLAALPRPAGDTLAALALSKLLQGLLAAPLAWAAAVALGHGAALGDAAMLAGLAVLLHAGVLVCRALFRVRMQLGRDVLAELGAVAVLGVLLWLVTARQATLVELVACHVAARALHLLVALALALSARPPPRTRLAPGMVVHAGALLRASWPIGLSGLLVCAYDAADALALARWAGVADVGVFNAAARLLMMGVIVVQALGVAVMPVLSAQWQHDRAAFTRTTQATLDIAVLLGGIVFCATWCGAAGLASFFKHDAAALVSVMQILSWALLARAVVTVFGPVLLISGRQVHTLWLTALVVVSKGLALYLLVPLAGVVGAAWAGLFSEVVVGLLPTVWLCQRLTGLRLQWRVPLRAAAAAVVVVGSAHGLGGAGTLLDGAFAALMFVALAALLGAVPMADLRRVAAAVARRRSVAVQP